MISLFVELEDMTNNYETKTLTLPCDLNAKLEPQHEYVIVYCSPEIPLGIYDDVSALNDVIEDINSENPEMTEDYLSMLLLSSGKDIFDEEIVRRIKENDFFFADISDIKVDASAEEIAARYLASEIGIPFSKDITVEVLDVLTDDSVIDYLKWEDIWRQYEFMGFQLIENFDRREYEAYIISWK